jgi:hypothetical protein
MFGKTIVRLLVTLALLTPVIAMGGMIAGGLVGISWT